MADPVLAPSCPSLTRARWSPALLLVLAVTAAARVLPVLCVEHVSPDVVEFLDIARNLRETGKPFLAVKAYYYDQTPIVHYGGYERPLLAALVLGLGSARGRTPILGAQWVSGIASVAAILCLILFLRKVYGWGPALAGGLVAGLAPPVLTASLFPWSDILALLALTATLATLAAFHAAVSPERRAARRDLRESAAEILVGALLAVAVAIRPVNLTMILPVALYFVAVRRSAAAKVRALILLLVGPAAFFAINAAANGANGAPAFMLPQGFIYRVVAYDEGILYWSKRTIPSSVAAFLAANLAPVLHRAAKQAIGYTYTLLFYHEWLFVWWVALPLVFVRAWRRELHPLTGAALGAAVLNFAVYLGSWSTYDPRRFLLVTVALGLPVCIGEVFQAWGDVRLRLSSRRAIALTHLLVAGTALAFGLLAARESYTALRARAAGVRFAPYAEGSVWNDAALDDLCSWLQSNLPLTQAPVASPFPWAINYLTQRSSAFWPTDLDSAAKLAEYLRAYPVDVVLFDPRARAADPSEVLLRRLPEWAEQPVGRFSVFVHHQAAGR